MAGIVQVDIKVHPRRIAAESSPNYDIGLIKLDRSVIFGPDLMPICIKVDRGGELPGPPHHPHRP